MAIIVIVQYNGRFLPDILLLTQAPIVVWFDGTFILYGTFNIPTYTNIGCGEERRIVIGPW